MPCKSEKIAKDSPCEGQSIDYKDRRVEVLRWVMAGTPSKGDHVIIYIDAGITGIACTKV